jgi:hypothetical protein
MENEEKLSAPKAVFGLRKKISSTGNLSKNESQRSSLRLTIPQKSESFRGLQSKVPKTTREKSRFAFDNDIEKDFEELSIKQEIFGILRSDSTFCESPFHPDSFPNKFISNVNYFDQNDSDLDKSIEINDNPKSIKEVYKIEDQFFADFEKENLYFVDKKCKN